MIIRGTQALPPAALRQNTHAPKTVGAPERPAADADQVSISYEAAQHAATSAGQAGNTQERYRLSGAPTLLASLNLVTYKMPEALVKEMEVRAKEEAVRADINAQYSREHRYQTAGQVLVDGKFYAEVDEAGGFGFIRNALSGLSEAPLDPRARLEEIARAAQGMGKVEIRYADFLPGLGGGGGPAAPESMLPAFTARDIRDIFAEAIAAAKAQAPKTTP